MLPLLLPLMLSSHLVVPQELTPRLAFPPHLLLLPPPLPLSPPPHLLPPPITLQLLPLLPSRIMHLRPRLLQKDLPPRLALPLHLLMLLPPPLLPPPITLQLLLPQECIQSQGPCERNCYHV